MPDGYSLGVSVGTTSTPRNNNVLPRVLPEPQHSRVSTGWRVSTAVRSSMHVVVWPGQQEWYRPRRQRGPHSSVAGQSAGRHTLDQKALSFGVDHGPLSGVLIGRTMQPQPGIPGNFNADKRWNSIDLGVTWRLPWRGSLSVGAQNLWSSGTPANTPAGPEPSQSRTPYVQYHQEL